MSDSIWKKEISFSRKKRDREIDRLVHEVVQSVSPSFVPAEGASAETLPTALAEAAVAAMAQEEAQAQADVQAQAEAQAQADARADAEAMVQAERAQQAEHAPFEQAPVEDIQLEATFVEHAPVEPIVESAPEPIALAAAPDPEPVEPWLAAPELPPAPDVPAAIVVHPPVSSAALPPVPEIGAKTPWWKKELGKKKPHTAKGVVPVAAPTETPPAAAAAAPFWKKQPSFSKPSLSLPSRLRGGKGGHGAKRLVGLKIGSSQLAAARVSNNGVVEVHQLAREALAPGIVVGGELRDPDALGEALKGFFARNKLPRKGVRLGIASNRIGVRVFDIVGVTEGKQLTNAIHFRAQETLPIPLDEAVLDYRVLDESTDADGQSVKRILLVVVYRELVDRYVSACRKAGITLAGIDLEAFALLRSLAAPEDRGSSALVAVSIGYDRSTFAVSDGRVCEFTRVLEWGGSALNVALARVFDSTPSEVEAIKRGLSLDGTTVPPGLTEEQTAQALDAVRRQVQSFARELVSSLQFYQNQPGSLGIGEIVLAGGTTHLHGLAEELERLIGVHVRVGDPLARVKVTKKVASAEQVGSLAVAIGLGIED
jgi:type IV pilus assembly protein PilM